LKQSVHQLGQAATSLNTLASDLNAEIVPMSRSLKQTADSANAALHQVQVTLAGVQHTVEPQSPLDYQLTQTLQDVSSAANAVHQLADYLERNPSALVRGRGHLPSGNK